MTSANVIVINEASRGKEGGWILCFQYCRYEYNDSKPENGYRFIWRKPNGNLQGARGQARIPSIADIQELTSVAIREEWGHYLSDNTAAQEK
ncbi:hypothetical protein [Phascolarctobacterium faecium]|uniref:hypothetical protein n=1 Tax=Phascolarctobacterium faecium TaxID=33025 RepID=UPI000F0CA479|nr:hypothetical protein [Phascolarctobacterium faecium]BBG63620.1 hypothetical protein PFJ30894_01253 [Phascolarctobacterium faecium]